MKTYVRPNSRWRSLSRLRICAWTDTSSADTGSSQTISFGFDRERARDADALALAAGELVREAVVVLGVEADDLEQLLHAALDLGVGAELVHLERLGDDEADALARVQRRVRVLEDHHHLRGGSGASSARESCVMSRPSKTIRPPVGSRRRMMQRAIVDLPQPDSPTTPSVSPSRTRERHAVDRLHRGDLLLEDDPARDREVLLEVLDDEQLVARQRGRSSSAPSHRHGRLAIVLASSFAASRSLVSSSRQQPGRGPRRPRSGASSGTFGRQTSITYGQRGWKRQPGGGRSSEGGWPGICVSALDVGRRAAAASRSGPTCTGGAGASKIVAHRPVLDDLAPRT